MIIRAFNKKRIEREQIAAGSNTILTKEDFIFNDEAARDLYFIQNNLNKSDYSFFKDD